MGSFSLCVENTARDVQSLLVLHKVHPKVCIDVRRRMDLLIEKSYEEMDVLEPGYGESSYDICHAIAKNIVKQTLEVGVPKSELAMAERRVAERDQAIFEWTKRATQAEEELAHAHAVAAEMKNAHNFMLHTYFREVLVLRHQLDELKKKQAASAITGGASSSASMAGGSKVGFPRFPSRQQQQQMNASMPPSTSPVTASASGLLVDGSSAGGPDDSSDGSASAVSPPRPTSGSTTNVPQPPPPNLSGGLENSMEMMNRSSESPSAEISLDTNANNSVSRAVARRVSVQTTTVGGRVSNANNNNRSRGNNVVMNVIPTNAIFDYQEYVKMLKVSQIDYEGRYKALLAERGEMLKRHREARVKSMMDSKATMEEAKFMIEELTKQLDAARAMSLMSEYKLRMCTEPVKEELNVMLNEIRMEVIHMQEEHDVDVQRMKAAVTEAQDRSDALLDFVLTYIQAIAKLVVIVYEDASAKTNDSLQNDPFTEIGYVLPSFFSVGDSELRVKPMVKLEEAARGRKALAPGSRPTSRASPSETGVSSSGKGKRAGSRSGRKSKVLIQDGGDDDHKGAEEGAADEEKNIVFITEPGQLYDATATRFWSEHPVSRNAQRVLSEFQALAMQLRARKEILLRQKDLLSRGGNAAAAGGKGAADGEGKSGRKRLGDQAGGRHQKPPGTLGGAAGITKILEVDEADVLEINDDFEATNPDGLHGMLTHLGVAGGGGGGGRKEPSPSSAQRQQQQQQHRQGNTPPPRSQQQQQQQQHFSRQQHQQQAARRPNEPRDQRDDDESRDGRGAKKKGVNPAAGGPSSGGATTTTTGRDDTDTTFSLSVEEEESGYEAYPDDLDDRASQQAQADRRGHKTGREEKRQGRDGGKTKKSQSGGAVSTITTSGSKELARIDTSGMNILLKQQVELLQTHVQQLQEQLQMQHEMLLKYHQHHKHTQSSKRRGKSASHGGEGAGNSFNKSLSTSQDMDGSFSSTSFFSPATPRPPQLHYVPTSAHGAAVKPLTPQAYQALLRLNKSGKASGRLGADTSSAARTSSSNNSSLRGMSPPPLSDAEMESSNGAGLGIEGHAVDSTASSPRRLQTDEGYHKMLLMAIESNKRREKEKEKAEQLAAAAAAHQVHPYFLQEPPEGWRCPYCDGYFTMEQAEKALADHPAPVATYERRLKKGWLDRAILKCKDFESCRHLLTELRGLRYRRVVYQARWSVARQYAGPVVLVSSAQEQALQLPPPLSREATAQRLCQRYEKTMQRLSKRISKMLLWLKYHIVNETEEIKVITNPGKATDIMHCIQEKRTRRAMFRSPYLIAPLERRRASVNDEDEEDEEKEWGTEENESEEVREARRRRRGSQPSQQQPVRYIMELGGRKMEVSSYWTEPLRDEAKKREEALAAERAHQRALKKRGMFQSPYGAVSGYCLGVQQGLPSREAHRGPVHLDFDYEKDRYFVSNEYGHSALEHPPTTDKEADAAGPPASTVEHPADAPSRSPFTMTQILVPAPLAMLPAPYNELAFAQHGSRGTAVSDGFIMFSDPSSVPQPGQPAKKAGPRRPISSPGPREASRQKDLLQPVYMVPMTIPVEPSEFAYHGYGRTRDAEVYNLHKKKRSRRKHRSGTASSGGSSGGGSSDDDESSRPGSNRHPRLGDDQDYRSEEGHPSSFSRPPPPLPPLPPSLQSTAYGILMSQDPRGRIVGTYAAPQPLATYEAIQQPPRVARPRNEEQQMFRIHAVGGGGDASGAGGASSSSKEPLSPRQKVVSALQQAKQQRAARLAEQERAEAEQRAQRQEEWDSRHLIPEPIGKEKFLRLRLPAVAPATNSSREGGGIALPDPNTSVRCQRKLATKDRLGASTVPKPKLGGAASTSTSGSTAGASTAPGVGGPIPQPLPPNAAAGDRENESKKKKKNLSPEYPTEPSIRIPPLALDN